MSEVVLRPGDGLSALLSAMQPREASSLPEIDVEAIHETAWNQGFDAGRESAIAELAPLRLHLAEAAAALQSACRIDAAGLRPVVGELVRAVAEAVLRAELGSGARVLIPLVEAALAAVKPAEMPTLKAHPQTLAALAPEFPDLLMAEDASLPKDGFVVAGLDFVIEAGLQARLAEIMEKTL